MSETDPLRNILEDLATEWAWQVEYHRDRLDHAGEAFFRKAHTRLRAILAEHPAPTTYTEFGVKVSDLDGRYDLPPIFEGIRTENRAAILARDLHDGLIVSRQVAAWKPVKTLHHRPDM